MYAKMRYQMERAKRVIGFSREHPSDLPGYGSAVDRLEERYAEAQQMADRETTGQLDSRGAIAERNALAVQIVADLRLLAGIARSAGVTSAGTPLRIRFPGPKRNLVQFVSGARVAVAQASAEASRLAEFGVTTDQLTATSDRIDAYEALLERRNEALRVRMGAHRQLSILAREMRLLVEQIGTINQHRFLGDAAMLDLWRATRHLPVRSTKGAEASVPLVGSGNTQIALPPGPAA